MHRYRGWSVLCSLFLTLSAESVQVRPLEGPPAESLVVSNESLELVNRFRHIGDMISAAVGIVERAVARIMWLEEI